MNKKIKIGSDFSGVGAFNQALRRLGIEYHEVFACDIDKYARKTFVSNYGTEKDKKLFNKKSFTKLSDRAHLIIDNMMNGKKPSLKEELILENHKESLINLSFYYPINVYDREIPTEPLDVYMTSPPCQAFSLAGKRKGEDDKRGILFYNSHEFIKKNKPRFFIFENVKGLLSDDAGTTFQRWIAYLGGKSVNGNPVVFPMEESIPYHVYWQVLNAKDYGIPQNRERVFIIGIRDDEDNYFSFPKEQHLTKRLKDVLEENVDEKYYLSDKMVSFFIKHTEKHQAKGNGFKFNPKEGSSIAQSVTTKAGTRPDDNYLKVKSATTKGYEIAEIGEDSINLEHPNSETRRGRVGNKVAQTLTTSCNQGVATYDTPKVKFQLSGGKWDKTHEQNARVYDENGISPTIHTIQGGNQEPKIAEVIQINPSKESGGKQPYQQNRIYDSNGISTTLCRDKADINVRTKDYRIRKLTPRECFRLMDFPDDFNFSVVSDSQAYKQAGNSICVGVLAEIIKQLKYLIK